MGTGPNHSGGSRRYIIRAVEDSLRRLQTDHIDLYQMHRADPDTDISETLSALSDLVRAGKVRAVGASTFPAELIVEAQWAAERGGHQPFRTEQPRYSILTRTIEAAVLPTAQRYGMGVLTYGPLSSGWLSGRADPASGHRASGAGAKDFDLSVPANRAKLTAVEQLTKLAADAGLPLAHLATAFVLAHPAVTSVLTGPRTMDHLQAALAGADARLDETSWTRSTRSSLPEPRSTRPTTTSPSRHWPTRACAVAARPGVLSATEETRHCPSCFRELRRSRTPSCQTSRSCSAVRRNGSKRPVSSTISPQ